MNNTIKNEIKARGLRQWQVACAIGISERTLICWLRTELTAERKQKIVDAIKILSQGGVKDE